MSHISHKVAKVVVPPVKPVPCIVPEVVVPKVDHHVELALQKEHINQVNLRRSQHQL
jgi:hypothetical protein